MISVQDVKKRLGTLIVGNPIMCVDQATSTNEYARKLAEEGAEERAVVLSGTKTSGRGEVYEGLPMVV